MRKWRRNRMIRRLALTLAVAAVAAPAAQARVDESGASADVAAVRPDDRAARFAPTGSVELVAVRPDGLDWGDVGIGAGSLFGLILVATGAAAAVRYVGRSATA